MRTISTLALHHHAHPAVVFAGGFTAVELMVTVAILAILSALAAPSFSNLFHSWRVRQAADALQHSLYLARSEAIKRGGAVLLQKQPVSASCASAAGFKDWDCGWRVCHDTNANGQCDDADVVLHHVDTPAAVHITRAAANDQGATRIKFDRWGKVAGTWPSFGIRPQGESDTHPAARRLCMGSGGRIRIAATPTC